MRTWKELINGRLKTLVAAVRADASSGLLYETLPLFPLFILLLEPLSVI